MIKLKPKSSQLIIASFKGTKYTIKFNPPMYYDFPLEIALHLISTYNTFPNLENCSLAVIYNNGTLTINIPTGAYEINDINNFINNKLKTVDIPEGSFLLEPNVLTSKSIITFSYPILSITLNDKLKTILGFNDGSIVASAESDNIVQINTTNSIFVETNIIEGTTVNGSKEPVIYSFFPNVGFGYKINININNPIYLPVFVNPISEIEIKLVNQKGELINNQNETVDLRFHLKEA